MTNLSYLKFFLIFSFCYFVPLVSVNGDFFGPSLESNDNDTCPPQKYGLEWIWNKRYSNYGWGDDTHRAVVTIFTGIAEGKIKNIKEWEMELMIHQLELQLAIALLKENRESLSQNELSLYIHALLITGQNPRYLNVDLIEKLNNLAKNQYNKFTPLALLCLCNARAIDTQHIYVLELFLKEQRKSSEAVNIENDAMLLTAYACINDENLGTIDQAKFVAHYLAELQKPDGSFGNIYTTAIVTHALKVFNYADWDQDAAENYLENHRESTTLAAYFTEMALRDTAFIKNIAPHSSYESTVEHLKRSDLNEVQYTVKANPNIYHTITIRVPSISVLEFMKLAANHSSNFRFTFRIQNGDPFIDSIAGIPNNPEDGLYWQLREIIWYDKNSVRYTTSFSEKLGHINELLIRNGEKLMYTYLPIM